MAREAHRVPYGYDATQDRGGLKGSLIVYDSLEGWEHRDVERVLDWAEEKRFARLVWFPLHEETVRRMGTGPVRPYHQRIKELESYLADREPRGGLRQAIDEWEGRRKKYTPVETALRFLTEKYPGPYFLYMTEQTANLFAGYASFDEWIRKVRLILVPSAALELHPKLLQNEGRWERLVPQA